MKAEQRPISLTYAPPPPPRRSPGIVDRHFLLVVLIIGMTVFGYCAYLMMV